jgi:hypothetical protein
MFDGDSTCAAEFFINITLKHVYHAIMGLVLTWLSTVYPSQYPQSADLFHHGKAIPYLRQRLSRGLYDDETYVSALCVMQTEVRSVNTV